MGGTLSKYKASPLGQIPSTLKAILFYSSEPMSA